MTDKENKVTTLVTAKTEIVEGMIVRLKSGSPAMTVGSIRTIAVCGFYDSASATFIENDFNLHELEIDTKKVDQSRFNAMG